MSIKTLHITNAYHPSSGGIRTFYNALLAAANQERRLVRVVVPAEETRVEEIGEFGRIYHVAAPPVPFLDSRYRMLLPQSYAWPGASPLRRILAAEQPDLVEVCDKFYLCYLAGVLRQEWIGGLPVPVIVGLTCERLDRNVATFLSTSRLMHGLARFYMRRLYGPRFDFHIAVSDYIADELRATLPERLRDRLFVAPMGADYDFFGHAAADPGLRGKLLAQLGGNEHSFLLLYAGRLSKEKNLSLLAEMMSLLSDDLGFDYRLLVVGSGPCSSSLRDTLDVRAPGRALFLGHCDRNQLAALYRAANVFVHPNPSEPFGIAPIEAMAAGLPVLAPDSGGLLTYANSENTWLTAATPSAFAEAIRTMAREPEAVGRKAARAMKTAASFSWHHATRRYFALYDQFHARFMSELRPVRERSLSPQTWSSHVS